MANRAQHTLPNQRKTPHHNRFKKDGFIRPRMRAKEVTMARKARHTESTVLSFHDNIKEAAKKNRAFLQTVCKGVFSELVVISVPPAGELGQGAHDDTDVIMLLLKAKEK